MGVMTTESVLTENIYKLKRDPVEAAKMIDKLDLTIRSKGANKHEVAGELFQTLELAGDYVRRLRHLARQHKSSDKSPDKSSDKSSDE